MAASHTVNDLVAQVVQWLTESVGQYVYDDQVRQVILYTLDEASGAYKFSKQLPARSRRDIITKVRELGGR